MFHVILRKDFDVNRPKGNPTMGVIEDELRTRREKEKVELAERRRRYQEQAAAEKAVEEQEDLKDHPLFIEFLKVLGVRIVEELRAEGLPYARLSRDFVGYKKGFFGGVRECRDREEYAYWDLRRNTVLRSDGLMFKDWRKADRGFAHPGTYVLATHDFETMTTDFLILKAYMRDNGSLDLDHVLSHPDLAKIAVKMSKRRQILFNLPKPKKRSIKSILS